VSTLDLQYLGVGGWLMRWGADEIATAPCFSNPTFLEVAFGKIAAKPEVIDRYYPKSNVQAILAGHSHYDHLIDVAHVATHSAREAKVYGNRTMRNILAAALPLDRLVAMEDSLGKWIPAGNRIRFMALESEHAPHFFGFKFYCGEVESPLKSLPNRASGWKEGKTLAFLIEFLREDGTPAMRVHYQDSASTPPLGFPPEEIDRVDIVIACLASFARVTGYPQEILQRLKPREVIAGHWEHFFGPRTTPHRVIAFSDAEEFQRRATKALPNARYHRPVPGDILSFRAE
jgi:hypothetical protein